MKVVFLGPQSCGKTSIIWRIAYDTFDEKYVGTVGIDFVSYHMNLTDNEKLNIQIWDTAGQERFYSIIPAYIRTALGVFLVFDLTDKHSFDSMRSWYQLVMTETSSDPSIVVVGNKSDLLEERAVDQDLAKRFSSSINASYFEVSAKKGDNVKEIMEGMARLLLKAKHSPILPESSEPGVLKTVTPNDSLEYTLCSKCY